MSSLSQELNNFIERQKKRKIKDIDIFGTLKPNSNFNPSDQTTMKIIGWRKTTKAFYTATNYILRKTEELFDREDNALTKKDMTEVMNDWKVTDSDRERQFMHMAYSFPKHIKDIEQAKEVLQEGLAEIFTHNDYMFAFHNDTNNLHAHILVNCKNKITNKQLRINNPELEIMHKTLDKTAIEAGLNIAMHRVKKTKEKKKSHKIKKLSKLSNIYHKRVPKWTAMFNAKQFDEVDINNQTKQKLIEIGLNADNQVKFANMYLENKSFATWSLNKNYKLFGLKQSPNFTARKLNIKKIEKELSSPDKNQLTR